MPLTLRLPPPTNPSVLDSCLTYPSISQVVQPLNITTYIDYSATLLDQRGQMQGTTGALQKFRSFDDSVYNRCQRVETQKIYGVSAACLVVIVI